MIGRFTIRHSGFTRCHDITVIQIELSQLSIDHVLYIYLGYAYPLLIFLKLSKSTRVERRAPCWPEAPVSSGDLFEGFTLQVSGFVSGELSRQNYISKAFQSKRIGCPNVEDTDRLREKTRIIIWSRDEPMAEETERICSRKDIVLAATRLGRQYMRVYHGDYSASRWTNPTFWYITTIGQNYKLTCLKALVPSGFHCIGLSGFAIDVVHPSFETATS